MDEQPQIEVKEEMVESVDSSKEEDKSHISATDLGNAEEEVALDTDGSSGEQPPATSEDQKVKEVNEQPGSQEESVVFEINSHDDDDDDDDDGPVTEAEQLQYEESRQLLQQLCEHRATASQRLSELHRTVAQLIPSQAGDEGQLVSDQLQLYEKHMNILTELQQQLHTDSESAEQQAEELRVRAQDALDQAEDECRQFLLQKQDAAVTVLSRRLGKKAAQAKVEEVLATEKLVQDELIKVCHKHIQLKIMIQRLEAELREMDQARDPLHDLYEQLHACRLDLKKKEDSSKMQKKVISSLELLSNVKEKLFWSQMEVQAQRQQLAQVEAMVAQKRDLLIRTRQARSSLHKDNQRLKELRGLLGNWTLLRDFEDTVDAIEHLEGHLEDLKFSCGTA